MQTIYICSAPGRSDDHAIITLLQSELESKHKLCATIPLMRPLNADRRRAIQRHLKEVDQVIFVLSREAYASPECYAVLNHALARKLPIIPISWAADSGESLDPMVDPSLWGQSDKDSLVTELNKLREQIDHLNWVTFHTYRAITDATEQQRQRRILVRRLLQAVENPTPTWLAFLSYAREDNSYVLPLKHRLEDLGPVWFDVDEIRPAKNWQGEIYRGIEQSHNFVFVVSTAWLTSPNCHREYLHAKNHNKRLIPVILQNFDEAAALAQLKTDPWDNLNEQTAVNHARTTWTDIQLLNSPLITSAVPTDLDMIVSSLDQKFSADSAYINEHTTYLVRAVKGEFLGWRELPSYWFWQQRSRLSEYPPSDAHRLFFLRSLRRKVQLAAAVIAFTLIALLVVTNSLANARAETEASRADAEASRADAETSRRQVVEVQAEESDRRLQVQASYNNRYEIELPLQPAQAALAYDALWVSASDHGVARVPLNGLSNPIILETGSDPGIPVRGLGYLWISNSGDGTLTRIDPNAQTSRSATIGTNPQPPLFSPGRVWVHALLDGELVVLDAESFTETARLFIGLNTSAVFSSGNALWFMDSNLQALIRVDAETQAITRHELPGEPQQALYDSESDQILVLLTDALITLDPRTAEVTQQTALVNRLAVVKTTARAFWATRLDTLGFVRITPQTLEIASVDLPDVADLYLTEGRVWGVTNTALVLYDAETLTQIRVIDTIADPRRLNTPISDGQNAWFVQEQRGTVFIIDEQTGEAVRDLQPCTNTSIPHFDGANMWFTCRDDQTIVALPADITFYGEQTVLTDNWTQYPVLINNILWVIQQGTGRITAFDLEAEQTRGTLDLGSTALPPLYVEPFLWTALPETGELIRIDTRQLATLTTPDLTLNYSPVSLGTGISSIYVFEGVVWIQRLDGNADEGFLTLLDEETLEIIKRDDTLNAFGGLYYDDGVVWTSTFDVSQGYIVKLDPQTATNRLREPMPITPYASVTPLILDGTLWLTAVVPPPSTTMRVGIEMFSPNPDAEDFPFYLLGLDPATLDVRYAYPLPTWTGTPEYEDGFFWYRQTSPVVVENLPPSTGNGVIAVRLVDGEVFGSWSVCALDGGFALAGELMWLGCMQTDDNFGVFRRDHVGAAAMYENVGVSPNTPVQVGECLVFTFSDSGTASMFNVETGELLRTYRIGSLPYAPIVYNRDLYVYNSGSDTLQRINIDALNDNTC